MQQWLAVPQNKVLALHLACDLLEHVKDASTPIWPVFMPPLFDALGDKDADARTAAAYAVNLASPIGPFSEAAPEAFRRLAKVVSQPAPKKRDEKAKVATENAVAALLELAIHKGNLCPPEINAFAMALEKMPLKADEEEAKKVHKQSEKSNDEQILKIFQMMPRDLLMSYAPKFTEKQ